MEEIFDFLGEQREAKGILPEGEGPSVFRNTGFIGPVRGEVLYKFWSPEDLTLYDSGYEEDVDYRRRGDSGSFFYYFEEESEAEDAAGLLDAFDPQKVWTVELSMTEAKGVNPGALDAFGQSLTLDARMTTLGSKKYRHEFHLMALPAIVDALARQAGYIDEKIWHIEEILEGVGDDAFTDEFQWRMTGDPRADEMDEEKFREILDEVDDWSSAREIALGTSETVPASLEHLEGEVAIPYTHSVLWQRRAELWDALGEPDPKAYIPTGSAVTDAGRRQETEAEDLIRCVSVVAQDWKQPIWARLHMCPDPRVDATYGEGKRLNLPIIGEIFLGESEAEEAAGGDTVGATRDVSEEPPVPEAWGEAAREDWRAILGEEKQERNGELPDVPGLARLSKQLSCTPEDIKAWWDVLGSGSEDIPF